jgi:hypothetical protein
MKKFELDDPMELVGVGLSGSNASVSIEEMAEVLVEEYARLGWNEQRLWTLFKNPFFRATHAIYRATGETYVNELIQQTLAKWGRR